MRRESKSLTVGALLSAVLLVGCGGSGDSVHIVMSGQIWETKAEASYCVAGPPIGSTAGFDGYQSSSMVCTLVFRTQGYVNDYLEFQIADVGAVFERRGEWLLVGGGLVRADARIGNAPAPVFDGGIRFTRITNRSGKKVCAEYDLLAGYSEVYGSFCATVTQGF